MADRNYLGTGMKFPVQADPGTGRFAMASGVESVRESVYIILMTARGERWMVPGFGSNINSYTFMDTSATMLNLMQNDLRRQILTQEPRISDVEITFDQSGQEGYLLVNVEYTVSARHMRDSLVFPFYLQAVREGAADGPVEE